MRKLPTLLAVFSASVAVWACSSAEPDTASGGAAQTVGSSSTKSPKPAASAKATASASASAAPSAVAKTGDPCIDACIQKYPKGAQVSDQASLKFSSCLCEADTCGSVCGKSAICTDAGAEPDIGDPCDSCAFGSGADTCGQQAEEVCSGDPQCGAFEDCANACDPGGPGGPGSPGSPGGPGGPGGQ